MNITDETRKVGAVEHTPGPWHVGYDGPSRPIIITAEHGTMLAIGRLENGRAHTYPKEDADARLIAAAPALLEALERAIASLGYDHDNKIDGGVYCYACQTHGETSATLPHKESCLKRQMREAVRAARGEA